MKLQPQAAAVGGLQQQQRHVVVQQPEDMRDAADSGLQVRRAQRAARLQQRAARLGLARQEAQRLVVQPQHHHAQQVAVLLQRDVRIVVGQRLGRDAGLAQEGRVVQPLGAHARQQVANEHHAHSQRWGRVGSVFGRGAVHGGRAYAPGRQGWHGRHGRHASVLRVRDQRCRACAGSRAFLSSGADDLAGCEEALAASRDQASDPYLTRGRGSAVDIEGKRCAPNRLARQFAPRIASTTHLVSPSLHVLQLSG
jgi:hypothetical protein